MPKTPTRREPVWQRQLERFWRSQVAIVQEEGAAGGRELDEPAADMVLLRPTPMLELSDGWVAYQLVRELR